MIVAFDPVGSCLFAAGQLIFFLSSWGACSFCLRQ